jgi:hypothetical protein
MKVLETPHEIGHNPPLGSLAADDEMLRAEMGISFFIWCCVNGLHELGERHLQVETLFDAQWIHFGCRVGAPSFADELLGIERGEPTQAVANKGELEVAPIFAV